MSTMTPALIVESNLSHAWGRAFLRTFENPGAPLLVSIDGFTENIPAEDLRVRQALDETLKEYGKYAINVTSMLIFPYKLWNLKGRPHIDELTELYLKHCLPRLIARDKTHNGKGTYFGRMIDFVGVKGKAASEKVEHKNQLKHITEIWRKGIRQSALQVSCFDPVKDQTGSALGGFPCLQQISFAYDGQANLAVNAYYPTQYMFDRAYGNYLGLCHLGHFMAQELSLKLVRLNCYIGRPELGGANKGNLKRLAAILQGVLLTLKRASEVESIKLEESHAILDD